MPPLNQNERGATPNLTRWSEFAIDGDFCVAQRVSGEYWEGSRGSPP